MLHTHTHTHPSHCTKHFSIKVLCAEGFRMMVEWAQILLLLFPSNARTKMEIICYMCETLPACTHVWENKLCYTFSSSAAYKKKVPVAQSPFTFKVMRWDGWFVHLYIVFCFSRIPFCSTARSPDGQRDSVKDVERTYVSVPTTTTVFAQYNGVEA